MNEEQLKRLENSWRTTEDIYHEIAKNYVFLYCKGQRR